MGRGTVGNMAAAGVNADDLTAHGVPHLSFNPEITPEDELPNAPSQETVVDLKHRDYKLLNTWTIWEEHAASGVKKMEWGSNNKEVVSFSSLKQFWSCFNHMPQPSILFSGKRYGRREKDGSEVFINALMLFKQGVRPEWEDPENAKGGHFQLSIQPKQASAGTLDELWNNIVLGMIAGLIEP